MKREFQAVILAAGKGSRMTELTGSLPKCLLPVGNHPMVHYPLMMVQNAGFHDVLLIVPDTHESEIRAELDSKYSINIDYFSVPANRDLGTADSLRMASKKLWSDLIILSCDTITDFPLQRIINFHRVHSSTVTALITTDPTTSCQGTVPGRKGKFKTDNDLIGIDPKNDDRLVFLNSEADFEEEIPFSLALFRQCQYMELNNRYLDAHVYVFKKTALSVLNEKPNISSIKGELIPYLLKLQFKRFKGYTNDRNLSNQDSPGSLNTSDRPSQSGALLHSLAEEDAIAQILEKFSATSIQNDRSMYQINSYPYNPIKCYAYVLDDKYILSRANHLLAYVELNKISRLINEKLFKLIDSDSKKTNSTKATISDDSVIHSNCKLADRCTIKTCIIAAGSNVADKSRLTNCVLMRDVQVAEGCVIQNSILCPGAVISEKCEIKDCIVGANQLLKAESKISNEIVVDYDQMMEF